MNNTQGENTRTEPDLDINNYGLEDTLKLFDLNSNFNENDLRRAKKKVLMMHPDKSNLDPKYFLFYSKAYKVVYSVHEFNNRSAKSGSATTDEYDVLVGKEETKRQALDTFFHANKKLKDSGKFNDWFNKEFAKQKVSTESEEKGYGEWLQTDEGIMGAGEAGSMADMHEQFNARKQEVRSLVQYQNMEYMPSTSTSNSGYAVRLGSDIGGTFSGGSGGGAGMGYQDLREAYTQTLIPVTEQDYVNRQKFRNVEEYTRYRDQQDTNPLSELDARRLLQEEEKRDEEVSTRRAFELAKQTEVAKAKNTHFWAGIMKIENGNNKI